MMLILMRHGIAAEVAEEGGDDAARALTPRGEQRVRLMAETMRRFDLLPTHYLASPRVRARQTAEQVRGVLGGPEVELADSLDFDGTWRALVGDVVRVSQGEPNAVVLAAGHQPLVGGFIAQATLGIGISMDVRKGAVAVVSWPDAIALTGGELRLYITHAMAARL